jgi:hypothetical protein
MTQVRDLVVATRERVRAVEGQRDRPRGKSFAELLATSPRSDPEMLTTVLNAEVERGRVRYHSASRRFELVRSAFEPGVLAALENLAPEAED